MPRRIFTVSGLGILLAAVLPLGPALATPPGPAPAKPLRAGSEERAAEGSPLWRTQYEQRFLDEVTRDHPSRWLTEYGAQATGQIDTPGNRSRLSHDRRALAEAGLHVESDSYEAWAPDVSRVVIEQTTPARRRLKVVEDVAPVPYDDPDRMLGHYAYSPSGRAVGEVVYVNYARPEDFAQLRARGIRLEGRIALARHGENHPGVKATLAAQAGVAALIVYSDPADVGFVKGEPYPGGIFAPGDAIHRGSVLRTWERPGDPLTPGTPSLPGRPPGDPDATPTIAPIPTTPISGDEARGLLEGLTGARVPTSWQGGFDVPYRLGPGGTTVSVDVAHDYRAMPVENIVTAIPGSDPRAGYVLVGAQRDAWGPGQIDVSGWVSAMELARALGELYREGWRPRRSVVVAGWDGSEYGQLGSTEHAENNATRLRSEAVAYIDLDSTAGWTFEAAGVPALDDTLRGVTPLVTDPRYSHGWSIYQTWAMGAPTGKPVPGRPGTGSDHTAFLHHVGVPSVRIGFASTNTLTSTLYDGLAAAEQVDPGFAQVTAGSEVAGLLALRLANEDVLPLRYSAYAREVGDRLVRMRATAPDREALEPAIDAARRWATWAGRLEVVGARLTAGGLPAGHSAPYVLVPGGRPEPRDPNLAAINATLVAQERELLDATGLPGRPWYRHQVWAPSKTTGETLQPLPALTEAVEAKDAAAFAAAAAKLTAALDRAATAIEYAFRMA